MPKSKQAVSLVEKARARQRVGAELRRLRRALDLTQWDLAYQAECSQTSIMRVEKGLAGPGLVRRIAAALLVAEVQAKKRLAR